MPSAVAVDLFGPLEESVRSDKASRNVPYGRMGHLLRDLARHAGSATDLLFSQVEL